MSPNGSTTNDDPITFTFQFSENVTDFDASDITITNGTAGTFTAVDGDTYTLDVTPPASNGTTVSVDVAASAYLDYAGNTNTATSTASVTSDTQAPSINSAVYVSSNVNPAWAKAGQTITYTLGFDENVKLNTVNNPTTGTNVSTLTQEFDLPAFGTSDTIVFTVANGDNGDVSINSADFEIIDQAGNTTTITAGDINTLIGTVIKSDTTKPVISPIAIDSNNALDTTLAKTNDTVKLTFTTSDNLSPTVFATTDSQTILNKPITGSTLGATGAGKTIERFTDGTEDSEVVVPFSFRLQDEAGNKTPFLTATTDGSEVKFDRTDPVVAAVKISAISQDLTAFTGDLPTYYARQGDTIDFQFDLCDFVDSQNNPPTGMFFGQAVTMSDGGLIGGACTTGDGNASTYRRWTLQQVGIDGVEGTVTFSIDVKDNAGNVFMSVTGTTDQSEVIFDKTNPTLPTTILDLAGPETAQFKHRRNASFTWSGHTDPNTAGADKISDLFSADVLFDHPSNGTNQAVVLPIATTTFTPAIPAPSNDPYSLHISTVTDKAGNKSGPEKVYTQLYTIGIYGVITDANGNVLPGANIIVNSEFGDTCLVGTEVCTGVTNANGVYEVLVRYDQDYVVSWYEGNHYLEKEFLHVPSVDFLKNISLQAISDPHHTQTGNQLITVNTGQSFIAADGETDKTLLFVSAASGEIAVTPSGNGLSITSFSRVHAVTSNNPNVTITHSGNTFIVTGAGNFGQTSAVGNPESDNSTPPVFSFGASRTFDSGASRTFDSGASRVGVRKSVGNGKANLR